MSITESHIRRAEERGFNREEAEGLLEFAKRMASKVVVEFVKEFVDEQAEKMGVKALKDKREAKRAGKVQEYNAYHKLLGKLSRAKVSDFTGYQEMKFDVQPEGKEVETFCMRIQLAIVPRDNQINIRVPDDDKLIRTMLTYLDKFADIARQYYVDVVRQDFIINDLAQFAPELDCSRLEMNLTNRTMYIDADGKKRVGVLCYYVGENGEPLMEDADAANS